MLTLSNAGRSSNRYEETQPFAILSEWVEGYQHSVQARFSYDTLVPSWIDLMLWAVLTGKDALVQPLWAKTRDPLRAALMATKCCQRLSTLPHLRSDQASSSHPHQPACSRHPHPPTAGRHHPSPLC